ncbi:hypothetical protein LTR36_004908 [Oleoguttula mirabilis]|uniref:non-specific serine/threonine protein kinase n=1 Tax=Oleoguttula mirabilis TaxID=1507867 RepID=A0AAV9JVR8_9PEZI|nr:hypothetical protein LTR36_004908 [Oleoguttula mirabilis]
MPPLPSPSATGRAPAPPKPTSRPSTLSRRPGSAASVRRPPSVVSTRNDTGSKVLQQNGVPSRLQTAKARDSSGGLGKENGTKGRVDSKPTARRQSSATALTKERGPSKDGTAQRTAKDVEGLRNFQLGDCIGKGASGSVYRALNWSTGETVAIKQVSIANLQKPELNVIMQEIDLLKNLNHPNIVKYHGFVNSPDALYIILEYCENGSLHSICKNFGKFPENLVSLYTAQVLQGLLFLHDQGVIHRDIKGANILTTKDGLVKLADFGVATKQQGLSEGSVVGTPYWMAPEVIELSGASTASDIWSLGCTVIELLDGKPPYHKFAPMPALFRIVNDDHPPLPEGVSPLVRDFLMQCFQKDPNLRVSAKKLLRHPWILGTKKGDVKAPVEHDQAVKSIQEWNHWLKSSPKQEQSGHATTRRPSARPGSKPTSSNDSKGAKLKYETPAVGARTGAYQLGQKREQPTKLYASPEDDLGKDNWDDDFESLSMSMAGLKLPEHRKPQDNFAGLFTAEKLKQYANDSIPEMDGKVEEWDDEFEGSLTVRSPLQLAKGDAVETVRPFYPPRTTSDEIRHRPPLGLAIRNNSGERHERRASKDSQPKTQILRPMHKSMATSKARTTPPRAVKKPAVPVAASRDRFREEEEEDYSDLVAEDEVAFQRKIAGYSPSRPFNPRDLRGIQTKLSGSVRRRTHTPTNLVHDAAAMRRTRSSLEMQKYAEDEEDEDFTDVFGEHNGEPMQLQPGKQRSPQSASVGSDSVGSERGTLKLSGSASWSPDDGEDEDDDPFAALEEELDEVDLESNVARDKHARLCTLVEGLVSDLKLSQPEDVLCEIVDQLLQILAESPDVKSVIVSSHGMLPILEILDTCTRSDTILRLLRIVNCIISDNVEVQENLCFVGGIPIICKFAHKKFSYETRLEAAAFVRMMYQTSTLTLQMFVSCGGLNVLVEFLEEDYDTEAGRELVLLGVNGVWSVFELQGPTPKNDFCRIFSRSSVLYPLSLVLNRVLDEEGELAEVFEGRIVNIFLLFSQAENHVKETVADRMVLKRVLKDLRRMSPHHQITMLKFIKNLSMLATTLDAMQNSNAIEVLTDLLGASMNAPHFREISNQVLNTMYNLCRLSKARQEDAALSGVIPLLQRIVQTERPLKEFALPILCDMAHSGKVGRKVLWQNKGLHFYVSLLADQYWAVTALDAIFIWLQEETAKVEEHLLSSSAFSNAIVQCFNESKADVFENLLEPLQKLLRLSKLVAASLARQSLFERSAVKLHAKKPLVRLNLLRVIRSICDANEEEGALIRRYNLLESVQDLAKTDQAILVREMANELVEKCNKSVVSTPGAARYAGLRRSSSSTMTPPIVPSIGSLPPTPGGSGAGRGSGYFDFGMDIARARPVAVSSPYRPVSRDASSSASSSGQSQWSSGPAAVAPAPVKSARLPPPLRTSMANMQRQQSRLSVAPGTSRLSMVSGEKTQQSSTPTHAPPSANTRSSAAVVNARRRRQTSGAELGRH